MARFSGRLQGGFSIGKKWQGGWFMAAASLASSIYGASQAGKGAPHKLSKKNKENIRKEMDPFGTYRPAFAEKLAHFSEADVVNTAEYKARQVAAARIMAAQGYTGSGNALAAAAEAAGQSYQQAFNNMYQLAGAWATPGAGRQAIMNYNLGAATAQQGANTQQSDAMNSAVYSAGKLYSSFGGGGP